MFINSYRFLGKGNVFLLADGWKRKFPSVSLIISRMYVCQEAPKKLKNVVCNGTHLSQFCFVVFVDIFSIVTATRLRTANFIWKLQFCGLVFENLVTMGASHLIQESKHSSLQRESIQAPQVVVSPCGRVGSLKATLGNHYWKKYDLHNPILTPLSLGFLLCLSQLVGPVEGGGALPSTLAPLVTSGPFKLQQ